MARIGIGNSLHQSQELSQQLLPRLLQSIRILQLPSTDLEGYLREVFEENEALSLNEPSAPANLPTSGRRGTREDSERYDEMLRNAPAPEASLAERVEQQLAMLEAPELSVAWVRFLIQCLDEHGFLTLEDELLLELAEVEGLPGGRDQLAGALALVQSLEPPGIGARNAVEALLLQLDPAEPDYGMLCMLLEDFLDEVAANKLPSVARSMGIDVPRLSELVAQLRELNPRPGAELAGVSAPPLRPEVLVEADGEHFEVRVDRSGLPSLSIDEDVRALARDPQLAASDRKRLRERLDRARWIVEAVEQRRATLLRVASATCAHQRAFLEHGPGHLVPLRMNQLAELLDLHVSTISRAVAGVFAQTPWGIFPLRYFFQGAAGASESTVRDDVRRLVGEVVSAEDPRRPLSDDEIAARVKERGLELARRTVAKYRGELGIPSSYRRRKYE